jgi:hypothetical protein
MEARGVGGKIDVMTFLSRRSLLTGSAAAGAMLAGAGRVAAHTPSGSALTAAPLGSRLHPDPSGVAGGHDQPGRFRPDLVNQGERP